MRKSLIGIGVGMLVIFAGCGGGGGEGAGVPLVSGSLAGVYKGQPFTPGFGVATVYMQSNLILIGTGPMNCGSATRPDPPTGTSALVEVPVFDVGTYSSVFVDMVRYSGGNFEGTGSNSATVTITASSAASVAGTISWNHTSGTTNETYGLSGDFEVSRCP
jgi:hypothetical protein